MKGLILEGVSSSGKSRVLRFLNRDLNQKKPANTKFFLSEHYSERMLEHLKEKGILTEAQITEHCLKFVEFFETLETMKHESAKFASREGNVTVITVVERFLLTHIANMVEKNADAWGDSWLKEMNKLYARLSDLGFLQVIFWLSREELEKRLLSTLGHRDPRWKEHVLGFGSMDDIVERYWKWQMLVERFAETTQTVIPQLIIDMSAGNDEDVAAQLWEKLGLNS